MTIPDDIGNAVLSDTRRRMGPPPVRPPFTAPDRMLPTGGRTADILNEIGPASHPFIPPMKLDLTDWTFDD